MLTFSIVPCLNIFKDNKSSLLPVSEFMLIYTSAFSVLKKLSETGLVDKEESHP